MTDEKSYADVTAIILVGGRGRRMGGQDKGWVCMHGTPLINHVLNRICSQVSAVVINANRNLQRYRALGYEVVCDEVPGFAGPLAGVHAGMAAAKTEWVLSLPCDTPFFPQDLLPRLYVETTQKKAQVGVACAGDRDQPVFLLAQKALRESIASYLHSGERKIDRWYHSLVKDKIAKVAFADANAFANINTPADLPPPMHR